MQDEITMSIRIYKSNFNMIGVMGLFPIHSLLDKLIQLTSKTSDVWTFQIGIDVSTASNLYIKILEGM